MHLLKSGLQNGDKSLLISKATKDSQNRAELADWPLCDGDTKQLSIVSAVTVLFQVRKSVDSQFKKAINKYRDDVDLQNAIDAVQKNVCVLWILIIMIPV